MKVEYVRNLHSNYERLLLDEKPEEKRYQYCILSRGGIKGILPCSLRYLDGEAYLYYDITSKQNIVQFHQKGKVNREWLLDLVESIRRLQQELGRFLLQENNVLWEPEQIFQDLESNVFSFLYVPYYAGENQFLKLLGFLVEKIDYEDEALVECVYKMYEQFEKNGETYLQEQIFKDAKKLEERTAKKSAEVFRTLEQEEKSSSDAVFQQPETVSRQNAEEETADLEDGQVTKRNAIERSAKGRSAIERNAIERSTIEKNAMDRNAMGKNTVERNTIDRNAQDMDAGSPKKLFGLFENKKTKKSREQELREEYRQNVQRMMDGYAVAEEQQEYGEEYGRTVFMSERPDKKEVHYRLYFADGRKASELDTSNLLIGKYKDKVDVYLEDDSVSRMHARVLQEQGSFYLEDSNSTNGTFLNKTRLQPYERKKLEQGDEIRCGNVVLYFR